MLLEGYRSSWTGYICNGRGSKLNIYPEMARRPGAYMTLPDASRLPGRYMRGRNPNFGVRTRRSLDGFRDPEVPYIDWDSEEEHIIQRRIAYRQRSKSAKRLEPQQEVDEIALTHGSKVTEGQINNS